MALCCSVSNALIFRLTFSLVNAHVHAGARNELYKLLDGKNAYYPPNTSGIERDEASGQLRVSVVFLTKVDCDDAATLISKVFSPGSYDGDAVQLAEDPEAHFERVREEVMLALKMVEASDYIHGDGGGDTDSCWLPPALASRPLDCDSSPLATNSSPDYAGLPADSDSRSDSFRTVLFDEQRDHRQLKAFMRVESDPRFSVERMHLVDSAICERKMTEALERLRSSPITQVAEQVAKALVELRKLGSEHALAAKRRTVYDELEKLVADPDASGSLSTSDEMEACRLEFMIYHYLNESSRCIANFLGGTHNFHEYFDGLGAFRGAPRIVVLPAGHRHAGSLHAQLTAGELNKLLTEATAQVEHLAANAALAHAKGASRGQAQEQAKQVSSPRISGRLSTSATEATSALATVADSAAATDGGGGASTGSGSPPPSGPPVLTSEISSSEQSEPSWVDDVDSMDHAHLRVHSEFGELHRVALQLGFIGDDCRNYKLPSFAQHRAHRDFRAGVHHTVTVVTYVWVPGAAVQLFQACLWHKAVRTLLSMQRRGVLMELYFLVSHLDRDASATSSRGSGGAAAAAGSGDAAGSTA